MLLVGRNASSSVLVLDLLLDVLRVSGVNLQSDGFSSEGLDKDLHASMQTGAPGEECTPSECCRWVVTPGWISVLLDVLNRVGGVNLQSDGFSSEGLDKDLHASTQMEQQVKSGLLLNIVSIVTPGQWISVLLDVLNRVGGVNLQSDSFSSEGLDKDLHASTQTEYQVKGGLLLNVNGE